MTVPASDPTPEDPDLAFLKTALRILSKGRVLALSLSRDGKCTEILVQHGK